MSDTTPAAVKAAIEDVTRMERRIRGTTSGDIEIRFVEHPILVHRARRGSPWQVLVPTERNPIDPNLWDWTPVVDPATVLHRTFSKPTGATRWVEANLDAVLALVHPEYVHVPDWSIHCTRRETLT